MKTEEPGFRAWPFAAMVAAQSAIVWGVQLARGPGTSADEFFCPTGGMLLEAGLPLRSDLLMLDEFCGGCAVFTLAARWVFEVLPAQVWSWRLLPFATSLLILAAVWRLGGMLAGRSGAIAASSLFVLAPPAYRHMALRGFANHVEVMALVLGAMVMVGLTHRRGRRRDAFVLGLLVGGALFFDYIAAFLVAALGVVWLARKRLRQHPGALLAGAALGVAPWFLIRQLPPHISSDLHVHGRTLSDILGAGVGVGERLGVLFGPLFWGNLFAPDFEFQPWVGLIWSMLALVAFAAAVEASRRRVVAQILVAGILLFVAEWLTLAPGLPTWPPVSRGGGESIHYLVPLLTMLPVAAAALWADGPLRPAALPVTLGLALLGGVGLAGDFVREWELDGMTQIPVGTHPGAVQVSLPSVPPPSTLVREDLDAVLGIRPGRLVARRALLASLGRALPGELPSWSAQDKEELAAFVLSLTPGDARSLYWGLAHDTVLETNLPEPLPPELERLLGRWPPELVTGLQRQVRSRPARERAGSHPELGPGRIRDLSDALADVDDPALQAVFAWEIGVAAGIAVEPERQAELGVVEQLEAAQALLPGLSEELESAATAGIIDTLVEDRCAAPATCDVLRGLLPKFGAAIDDAECTWHLRCTGPPPTGPGAR